MFKQGDVIQDVQGNNKRYVISKIENDIVHYSFEDDGSDTGVTSTIKDLEYVIKMGQFILVAHVLQKKYINSVTCCDRYKGLFTNCQRCGKPLKERV